MGKFENLKISLSGVILLGLFSNLCCFECKHVFLLRTYIFFCRIKTTTFKLIRDQGANISTVTDQPTVGSLESPW